MSGLPKPTLTAFGAESYVDAEHMSNRQFVEYIYDLRGKIMAKYVKASGAEDDIHR